MKFDDMINKVHNADCLEFMKDIPDKSIDLIVTDIPYGKVNRGTGGLRVFDKGDADTETVVLGDFIDECVRVLRGSIYIFCGTEQVSEIRKFLVSYRLSTRLCVWEKTNPSPTNGEYIWLSGIESCVFGKFPKAVFNEHCKNTVWRYPSSDNYYHVTEKPLPLFKYLVRVSSGDGDLVLDPFLGSGTTAVACKELGRRFIGIEINPDYCKIAERRLRQEVIDFGQ